MLKKIILVVVIVLAALSLTPCIYSAGGNLIKNPSFEEEAEGKPNSWNTWAWNANSEFKLEQGEAHSGNRFATITNKSENDARYKQTVNVKENAYYKLSCWIKTENIGGQKTGANLSIEGRVDTSRDIKGTNGNWENVELYVKTGKGINTICVTAGIGGYGNINTGKASFDDVSVEEVDSIPDGVTVAQLEQVVTNNNQAAGNNTTPGGSNKTIWIVLIAVVFVIAGAFYFFVKSSRKGDNEETGEDENEDYEEEDNDENEDKE